MMRSLERARYLLLVALLVYIPAIVQAVIESDEINGYELPGWNKPLPSRQFSGYIHLDDPSTQYDSGRKHLHYWFVESERNPKLDPVVLWLNGGPGCSSLDGYLNENGPLLINHSGELPELMYNKWTWTKLANMIFLEAPVGVGFSYSDNPFVYKQLDDTQTANDNYEFLVEWFERFSEYQHNELYIMGESYAGIYIPMLVYRIMEMNDKGTWSQNKLNLKGFAVGNGCIGNKVGTCYNSKRVPKHVPKTRVDFYYNHALFSTELYNQVMRTCDYSAQEFSPACKSMQKKMSRAIGRVNVYNIYSTCRKSIKASTVYSRIANLFEPLITYNNSYKKKPEGIEGPIDCLDDSAERVLLDNPKTRDVLHVASVEKIGGWHLCAGPSIKYRKTMESLLPIYPTLIKRYRTLIFNGDVDGAVPYTGDEQWTSGLGFEVKTPWKAWMIDNQVVGYVTAYNVNSFKFVTVKGAGHMVPQYKPEPAFVMFEKFLLDLDF